MSGINMNQKLLRKEIIHHYKNDWGIKTISFTSNINKHYGTLTKL